MPHGLQNYRKIAPPSPKFRLQKSLKLRLDFGFAFRLVFSCFLYALKLEKPWFSLECCSKSRVPPSLLERRFFSKICRMCSHFGSQIDAQSDQKHVQKIIAKIYQNSYPKVPQNSLKRLPKWAPGTPKRCPSVWHSLGRSSFGTPGALKWSPGGP